MIRAVAPRSIAPMSGRCKAPFNGQRPYRWGRPRHRTAGAHAFLADNAGRKARTKSTVELAGSVPFIRFVGSILQPQSDSTAFARGHAGSSIGG